MIHIDFWQHIVSDECTALVSSCSQVHQCFSSRVFTGNLTDRSFIVPYARICEQVLNQPLHAIRSIYCESNELVSVRIQPSFVTLGQELRITGHHAQGLL